MGQFDFFIDIIIILVTAFIFGLLAKKFKQPPITGYVIGGLTVSVLGAKFLTPGVMSSLADTGIIFLMFTLGIEFSFRRLLRVKNVAVLGALLQIFIFTVLCSLFLSLLFKLDLYQSIFLSLAFSLSSTAIAVKILFDKGEVDTLYGEILTGWLLVQDLAVIPIWILLPILWKNLNNGSLNFIDVALSMLGGLLKTGIILYIVYWLGKRLVPLFLGKVAKLNVRELFLIAVVLLIASFSFLVSYIGLSPALGAFLAGLLVAETTQNQAIFAEIRPLRDILSIVFFVSLGLLFNTGFLFTNFSLIVSITLFVIILKLLVSVVLMVYFKYHSKTIFLTSLGLISVGEFAFVLGRFGLDNSYLNENAYNTLMSVTVLTLVGSPWIMSIAPNLYHAIKKFTKNTTPFIYDNLFSRIDQQKKFDEDLPFNNHVVICGHGRVGRHISQVLDMAGIPYVVIDYDQRVVSELTKHAVNVIYGDPSDIDVLDYAQVDHAKIVVIAVPDRHSQEMIINNSQILNKNILIICRSHYDEDKKRLYALGAHSIIQPEFEAALHMSGVLLNVYKLPKEQISSYIMKVRKEG